MTSLAEALDVDEQSASFIAAKAKAKQEMENAEIRSCPNGCTNYYHPGEDEPFMGFGPAGCEYCS